jgi:hypothetical protein
MWELVFETKDNFIAVMTSNKEGVMKASEAKAWSLK